MNVVPGNRTVRLPPASLARTVRSLRSSKAPKASSDQQCPKGAVHGLGQKLPCSTTACQPWCRNGTRCTGVTPHAPRQSASHRQDSRDVFRRANSADRTGLVQQPDQVAAARDLSLFVRPHRRSGTRPATRDTRKPMTTVQRIFLRSDSRSAAFEISSPHRKSGSDASIRTTLNFFSAIAVCAMSKRRSATKPPAERAA